MTSATKTAPAGSGGGSKAPEPTLQRLIEPQVIRHGTWRRVTKTSRCPICQHPDWCSVTSDGSACICMRVQAGSVKRTHNGGFLHILRRHDVKRRGVLRVTVPDRAPTRHDMPTWSANYRTAASPVRLRQLADGLGLSVESLARLGVGWASAHGAWSFPMTDAAGNVVGIRLRLDSGRKFAVAGGREGLFLPAGLAAGGRLVITEGPTDCAAMLDLGLPAVGRPSCTGGTRLLVELVKTHKPAEVVIVADADEPGQRGAQSLAAVLIAYCPSLRTITPPPGIKDARAWKMAGATTADLVRVIAAAPVATLAITGRTIGRKGDHRGK